MSNERNVSFRHELADPLRSRRGRLRPGDVGPPTGARRRTPGPRREEVAALAGISTTYTGVTTGGTGPRAGRSGTAPGPVPHLRHRSAMGRVGGLPKRAGAVHRLAWSGVLSCWITPCSRAGF